LVRSELPDRLSGVRLGDEDDFLVGSIDEFDKGLVLGDGLVLLSLSAIFIASRWCLSASS